LFALHDDDTFTQQLTILPFKLANTQCFCLIDAGKDKPTKEVEEKPAKASRINKVAKTGAVEENPAKASKMSKTTKAAAADTVKGQAKAATASKKKAAIVGGVAAGAAAIATVVTKKKSKQMVNDWSQAYIFALTRLHLHVSIFLVCGLTWDQMVRW